MCLLTYDEPMSTPLIEFIGIYDADSTLKGEVSYWIGARLGTTHCSLCDITHGIFTKKSEWKKCATSLSIPFVTYHRNDAPADVLEVVRGSFPVVLARTTAGLTIIRDKTSLEEFNGSATLFAEWLQDYLASQT